MQSPQTIQVLVRARPGNAEYEIEPDGDSNGIKVDPETSVVSFTRERKGQSDFQFTKVFDHTSSQRAIYDMCNISNDVVEGINCCVLAYGQTGSGKTYTMYGTGWEESADLRMSTARNDLNKSTEFGLDGPIADTSFDCIQNAANPDFVDEESLGIVPRSVSDLFKVLEERAAANPKFDYSVSKFFFALYFTFFV